VQEGWCSLSPSRSSGTLPCLQGAALLVGVVLALVEAAPQDMSPMDNARARVEIVMVTQSPAEAIQDAIRYDPEVAAALQSNTTNL